MIYALVLAAALGAPGAPASGGGAPRPAIAPVDTMRSGTGPTSPLTQQQIQSLTAPQTLQNNLPPPCPPQQNMPLNGFVTLPVYRLGWCNPNDWRPLWYNFQGP
jgi:hypothetical protein